MTQFMNKKTIYGLITSYSYDVNKKLFWSAKFAFENTRMSGIGRLK